MSLQPYSNSVQNESTPFQHIIFILLPKTLENCEKEQAAGFGGSVQGEFSVGEVSGGIFWGGVYFKVECWGLVQSEIFLGDFMWQMSREMVQIRIQDYKSQCVAAIIWPHTHTHTHTLAFD